MPTADPTRSSSSNVKGYHPATVERMEECIACASCARMCPDSVITVERV
jgi:2-oxoglutarate ferredoxin oxidoreductase subunit delta